MWINCLIQQVTSLPLDIYIEKWIYDSYPGLRNDQLLSLQITYSNAIQTLEPEKTSQIPISITDKTNAMNYAYYKKIDSILGTSFFDSYNALIDKKTGDTLYNYISREDEGLIADITLVNQWASRLGINTWFKWGDFENIPHDYEHTLF